MIHVLSPRQFVRQLDLGTLDLFVLVCETGSIARAAERGGIATSALSRRIADLEGTVGAPLLSRHARGVRPTFLGEQLLGHAVTILVDVERLRGELDEFGKGVRGRVKLGASASAVEQFLPADLSLFSKAHPDIRIDLHQASSEAVAQSVLRRDADLGICDESEHGTHLQFRPYRTEHLVLVMRPDHPLAGLDTVAYAESLEYEQIGIQGSSAVQANLNRVAREARRALRQRIEVNSLSAMCRMIECNMGIGVMALGALQTFGARGLQTVALSDAWAMRIINLYALDFDNLSVPAERLAKALSPKADA